MTDQRMNDEQLGYPWDAFPERASDFAVCIREHKKAIKRISELEAALRAISESQPVGDTGYSYGYAWEFCVITASRALLDSSVKDSLTAQEALADD